MDAFAKCGGLVEALNTNIYGNGNQTIVLSHGFGSDQSVWHYLVPVLACYFKAILYDLVISPNVNPKLYNTQRYEYNFSAYAQDLVCLLDELHVENTIFIGHSMSAMIGCIAATKRPHLFQHLFLLAGSPRYLNTRGYNAGHNKTELKMMFNSIKHNFSGWIQEFVPSAIGVNVSEAIVAFEDSLSRMKPEIVLSAAKTVFLSDNRSVLPHLHLHTTIIQSHKDAIVPKSAAFYMKKSIGTVATVKILKTEGHFPQLTAPLLLLNVLKKVLKINSVSLKLIYYS